MLLYVERWLKAPVQMEDGSVVRRTAENAAGCVIPALLANLFLHYAFDRWMVREPSAYSVRALRGRCHLSLPKRRRGAGVMERACRSSCIRMLVPYPGRRRSPAGKDANRRGDFPIISFDPSFSISSPAYDLNGKAAHGFGRSPPAESVDGHQPDRSALVVFIIAATKPRRSWPRCTNPGIRWLDQLLQPLLQDALRPTLKRIDDVGVIV